MPVIIQSTLPARRILESENIFVMGKTRALHQDIRPLKLAILNLMPTKIVTETQLLRLLSNSALQVDVTLLHMNSHESKNTPEAHLLAHYVHFEQVQDMKFDGLVITGAPVEDLPFEEVDYWAELQDIFDWSETNVYSTFNICWAAQAGLYHRHGVPKYPLPAKMFGVFRHQVLAQNEALLRGFDDFFYAPHSTAYRDQAGRYRAPASGRGAFRIGGGRGVYRSLAGPPAFLYHRAFGIRPADPAGRI